MEKMNPIKRIVLALTDFSFSNRIAEEKSSKAFGVLMMSFLLFVVFAGIWTSVSVKPEFNRGMDQVETIVGSLPEFTISHGELISDDTAVKFYQQEDIKVVYDIHYSMTDSMIKGKYGEVFVIRKDGLKYDREDVILFSTFSNASGVQEQDFTKENILTTVDFLRGLFFPVMIVLAVLFLLFLLFLSLVAWVMIVIINGFMRKDILTGSCYKLGIYAMLPANILMVMRWFVGVNIPFFTLIYLGVVGYYGYRYLGAYESVKTIDHIYE
ncbi:MAG: DUF1189 family protein [Clostridia bacterium]|nr:DUF1189 family protein [Clostridia bacterium]